MVYIKDRDNKYQKEKSYNAARKPFAVRRPNWDYSGSIPKCTIHNEFAVWHKNKSRSSGGQWVCKICAKNKTKIQRRKWKYEHINPLEYNLKRSFTMAKCHSKKIGREFTIDFDDILNLLKKQNNKCAVSNQEMSFYPGKKQRNRNKITIDRINSSEGYIKNNIHLVCDWVNRAKTDLSIHELEIFAKGILKFIKDQSQ